VQAAAAAEAATLVKPRVKKERKRKIHRDSDDDEDFELNPAEEDQDSDSDNDGNAPIHQMRPQHYILQSAAFTPQQAAAMAYAPMHLAHQGLPHHTLYTGASSVQPRNQPKRHARNQGREDLKAGQHHTSHICMVCAHCISPHASTTVNVESPTTLATKSRGYSLPSRPALFVPVPLCLLSDPYSRSLCCVCCVGAYVNLDLVELDEVPGLEDDVDESTRKDIVLASASSSVGGVDINPQVRQALSAIVEAIAEVSSMKADEEAGPTAMDIEAQQQQQQQQAALMAQQQAQAQAALVAQAQQMGLTPQALLHMQQQHMQQRHMQQQIQQQLQHQQLQQHQQQQQLQQQMHQQQHQQRM